MESGFYDQIDVGGDEDMPDVLEECMDEALEHTILDKIMEEWLDDVKGVEDDMSIELEDECVC